ncbi:FtsW/RodA/SpoVE family cell cycle protein [Acidaminobacterium chupaoyuni]
MKNFFASLRGYLKQTDLTLLFLALITSFLGLVFIYSATRSYDTSKFIIVQGGAIFIGIFAFIMASLIDFENISRFWKVFFVFNLLFLASVFVLGEEGGTGNRSWIRFAGIGIQPAEFGKLIFIFTLSSHINQLKERINSIWSVIQLCLHGLITTAFVYLFSKDLGMAVSYLFIFAAMIFVSGISLKWIFAFLGVGAAGSPLVWKFLSKNQKDRILVILDPSINPARYYQTAQSKLALGAGQLYGSGFLQGRQTQFNKLPAKHTDSIFSVIGEEFGFIGCCVIMVLLALIILRIFRDSTKAGSNFGFLMCVGIGSMFMVQTIINIGLCVGLLPVIGLTLPFLSYGGSSIVTMFLAIGVVASFVMRQRPSWLRSGGNE